jgi:circadian clock protein KaiC
VSSVPPPWSVPASPSPASPGTPAASARLAGRLALGADGHESGAAIPKVATGIGGFDHVAMGGLPLRRTTVVAGPAGAAKTLFAAQFLAEGVRLGQPGVFVTLEEPAADLRANFATLGWDVPAWEAAGDWRFVDGSPLTSSETGRLPDYHVETLVAQIGAAVDRTGAQRLALDSLSAVLSLHPDAATTRQLLRTLVLRLRSMDLTAVLTVETQEDPGGSLTRYGVEEFVADNVVLMRNVREGTFRRRTLEVLKMRGAMHHKGDVPFTVVPGEGLRVLPITASSPAPRRGPRERVSSGVAGLDELTHGGLFRGSTTLVSGPTGSGKTMMGTQFAVDGVASGENVLVVAYEESHEQVLANGAALGCDFERHEEQGVLRIESHYPEVASLDDHLVELRELVERLRPTRVVFDGLSALERLGSPPSYRGFLLGVTTFVRSLGLATFITSTPPSLPSGSSTGDHLTSFVDTVIVLRHHEVDATVHRGLHIQRMRGSHHENTVRELVIDEHGVRVGNPLPGAASG